MGNLNLAHTNTHILGASRPNVSVEAVVNNPSRSRKNARHGREGQENYKMGRLVLVAGSLHKALQPMTSPAMLCTALGSPPLSISMIGSSSIWQLWWCPPESDMLGGDDKCGGKESLKEWLVNNQTTQQSPKKDTIPSFKTTFYTEKSILAIY